MSTEVKNNTTRTPDKAFIWLYVLLNLLLPGFAFLSALSDNQGGAAFGMVIEVLAVTGVLSVIFFITLFFVRRQLVKRLFLLFLITTIANLWEVSLLNYMAHPFGW